MKVAVLIMVKRISFLLVLLWGTICACSSPQSTQHDFEPWQTLFDGSGLDGWESISFGGEGEIEIIDGSAILPMGSPLTGIRPLQPLPQRLDYEVEVKAARMVGNDFFCGLTFPVAESHATVVLGGWGGGLCGLSCVDDEDASYNQTRSYHGFEFGQIYTLRVRVTSQKITAWLDDEVLFEQDVANHKISLRTEMLPSVPFGVCSFLTRAAIHSVRWRAL
jgi:hypothetical protein